MKPDPTVARAKYLDALEAEGGGSEVRELVAAIVYPIAGRLSLEPKTEFARFAARMTPRVDYDSADVAALDPADQRTIWGLRAALAELPPRVLANRIDIAFNMIVGVFAAFEVRREEDLNHGPALDELSETLIDMVTAALTC